ncbi:MAG: hypothetical protein EHM23_07000 [Acidobacteria bacterium]|nr:MAG: hypothetical protein EHM23_07000 [Acidobacteriota bacterium]
MTARENSTEPIQTPEGSKRRRPGRDALDLRQFIAALLIVFLTSPYSLSPQLLAASDPGQQSTVSSQPSAVSSQPSAVVGQPLPDAAISRKTPVVNTATINGSLRVFQGATFTLANNFQLTGDLYTAGTPNIQLLPGASHGGIVDEGGAATPSYMLMLGVKLPGKIHIHTNPLPLPSDIPASVPTPAGTRTVTVQTTADIANIGDWATVRNLTVNGTNLTVDVPPGNYGQFILNGNGTLRFSGGEYNFATAFTINGTSRVEVSGACVITTAGSFTMNGANLVAAGVHPSQVRFNVLGTSVILNFASQINAMLRAPNAQLTLNGSAAIIRGQALADRLILNAGKIIGDVLPSDTTAPVLQVLSPADNTTTYASKIAVHGLARDEGEITTGVHSVSVNGVAADFDPVSGNWMATVPLVPGDNVLTASALDGATPPNTGTAQVHVLRQNPGPPALSLTHPADGAFLAANTVTVAGRVTSDSPEVTVSVTVNGQAATVAGNEFARSLPLTDGPNPITVVATDSLGQTSQQAISVTCDLTPPQVSLVAVPSVVLPGGSYRVTAEASDNYRLSGVEFSVDGQRQAELQAEPFEFTYLVPPTHVAGQRINISALARDASGRVGTDSAESRVSGPGGVAGRVFDDRTGYPLGEVAVASTDGAAAASAADGAWFFVSPLSVGVGRFSKSGYTISERDFGLGSGQGAWLLDARLTPIDARQNNLGPDGGQASDSSGRMQATVAPGTLAATLDLRLTAISQQGLANVLPFGWSPVPGGVVDFRPANPPQGFTDVLPSPARLVVSDLPDSLGDLTPALVFYDELSHRWNVVQAHVTAAANGSLAADLARFGQYAFVVPDAGVTAPPAPVEGQTLRSGPAASHALLDSATAFATASPAVALYSPEAQSTIRVTADPAAKIPSGIWCEASFDERYDLRGQSEPKLVERARQTFVLYSYPAATSNEPNRLSASFTAKPTILDYPLAEFRAANLHVGIRSAEPELGSLVDSTGGTVKSAGGVDLELPDGALSQATPVFLQTLRAEDIAVLLPEGYEIVVGALVDLSGATLTASARLTMPAYIPETTRLVVARIITAGDRRGPKLVARAVEVGGRLESALSPPAVPAGVVLPGITEGGTYAFIRLPGPFGYASGTVTHSATPAAGVRLTVDTTPFIDVTASNGRYLLPGLAGSDFQGLNNLSAASLASDETGNATVSLASQDALSEAAIAVASIPLAVASVNPSAGATGIAVSAGIRASFTKPVTATSVSSSSFKVSTTAGNPVAGSVVVLPGNQAATFTPSSALAPGTTYRVELTAAVLDLYGHPLPAAFSSTFTTAATPPAAGRLTPDAVSISYPDASGFVTITIAAGLVPSGSMVVAINETWGTTSTITAGSGALSLRLMARLGDDIRIIVRQPSGVDYEVAQAAYRSPDGFSAVGPSGGTVVSDDGTIHLVVDPGAINGLAEIRVTLAPESSITIPRLPGTPMDPANVPFGAGVQIEMRGDFTSEKELHVDVAAPPGVPEGLRAICLAPAKAIDPNTGEEVDVWNSVTSAVVENGRFKTTSLPFAGLFGMAGIFSIYVFMPVRSHVLWGWVKGPDTCDEEAPNIPVPGVLCVNPAAGDLLMRGQITARTGADGRYSMFDVSGAASTNIVLFIDEVKHRRSASGTNFAGFMPQDTELLRFLGGLQGFSYGNVDGLLPCPPAFSSTTLPLLVITGKQTQVLEGLEDPLPERGIVPVGAEVEVKVTSDQDLVSLEGKVTRGGVENNLNFTQTGRIYKALIAVQAEGGYGIEVEGKGAAGTTVARYQFAALRDQIAEPHEGPPLLVSTVPRNGATEVDITTDVRIEFSEPVRNLVGGTTVFLDGPGGPIGGTILAGGVIVGPDTFASSIVFKPERSLLGGQQYSIRVTGVVDNGQNPLDKWPGASFTTFAGKQLSTTAEAGLRVAVDGRYSFVLKLETTMSSRLIAYDSVDPQNPEQIGELQLAQYTIDFAVSSQTEYRVTSGVVRRIGVITAFYPLIPDRAANLWIVNLDDPKSPSVIGVASLYIPQGLFSVPLSVTLHNGRAYVGSAPYHGLFVVDIQKAIKLYDESTGEGLNKPRYLALLPYRGFGEDAIAQSLLYHSNNPTVPAMADSISVITQNVSAGADMAGPMPVAFAVNSGARVVLAAGFPTYLDGTWGHLSGGPFGDKRILSWLVLPENEYPVAVRALSQVRVGNDFKDIAVVLTGSDLRIYDATQHPMTTLLSSASRQDLGIMRGATNHFVVQDGLAYISSAGRLSVIDVSNPTAPTLVTVVPGVWAYSTSLAIREGFVHSVSPDGGYQIGIARPVAQLFIHGKTSDPSLRCSNPVLIKRNEATHDMLQEAEIFVQMYGIVEKLEDVEVVVEGAGQSEELSVSTLSGPDEATVKTGVATWIKRPIDTTKVYTARLKAGTYESEPQPIPFSFLISDYQESVQALKGTAGRHYSYVLAANATVDIHAGDNPIVNSQERRFGLNVEKFGELNLAEGRYPLTLVATWEGGTEDYEERVGGVLEVAANPTNVRPPGHTVVGGVDLGTGQLGLSYTDVFIPGRGLSLEFTRYYNQGQANIFGPLGYGWRHNYQMLLIYDRQLGIYTVLGADGQGQSFQNLDPKDEDSALEMDALLPFHTRLKRENRGSFDYIDKAGVKYHFPGALVRDSYDYYRQAYLGNLDYIEEPNKNRIELFYEQGRLMRVEDSSHRELKFEYEEAAAPFVGAVLPNAAASGYSSCIPAREFSLIRDRFAQSNVGQGWRIKNLKGPGGLDIDFKYNLQEGNLQEGNLEKVVRKPTGIGQAAPHEYSWTYAYQPEVTNPGVDLRHILASVTDPNSAVTRFDYKDNTPVLPVQEVDYAGLVKTDFEVTLAGARVTNVAVKDGRGNTTTYTLDSEGKGYVETIAAPRGATTIQKYIDGLKQSETDPEGLTTRYLYDDRGNPTLIEIGSQKIQTDFHPKFSKLTSLTDARGFTTTYQVDDETGNVTGIQLPSGSKLAFGYDGADLVSETDERSLTTEYGHDDYGNVTSVSRPTGGDSATASYSYDERSRLTSSAGNLSPSLEYTLDTLDRVVALDASDPAGIRESYTANYTYQPGGEVLTLQKSGASQAYAATYGYDSLSRLRSVAETVSGAGTFDRSYTYDGNSNLETASDRRGVTSTYTYDALNFLTTVTTGGFATSQIDPDLVGNAVTVTDLAGKTETLGYDGLHRLTDRSYTVGGQGYSEHLTLDGNGNVTVRERNGRVSTTDYDPLNRPVLITDPAKRTTTIAYEDASGLVTTVDSLRGLATVTQTDGIGRTLLRRQTYANKSCATTYSYQGLHVSITDPRGVLTEEDHSSYGDVGSATTHRSGGLPAVSEERGYAPFGGLTSWSDGRGIATTYTVDGLNRVMSETRGSATEGYTYDGEGNVETHTDAVGVVEKTAYDDLGRVTSRTKQKPDGTSLPIESITYVDAPGEDTVTDRAGVSRTWPYMSRKEVTDAASRKTVYRYDEARRVMSETNPENWTRSFTYDVFGNLETETDFAGKTTSYTYNELDQLTSITDSTGNKTEIATEEGGGQTRRSSDRRGVPTVEKYDALGRLAELWRGGQLVKSESCDCNGNVTDRRDGAGRTSELRYNELGHLVEVKQGGLVTAAYVRDEVGNATSFSDGRGGAILQTFDAFNRMTSRSDGAGNVTGFEYDLKGRLAKKTEPRPGAGGEALVTSYEYNEFDSLTRVIDAEHSEWNYGYDESQRLTTIDDPTPHPPTRLEYTPAGRVSKVTRPDGVVSTYEYDAGGNRTLAVDPAGRRVATTYDDLNRPRTIAVVNADGTLPDGARGYAYEFDPEGNLTRVDERVGFGAEEQVRSYLRTYDPQGRLAAATDPFGRTVKYEYDAAGNLGALVDAANRRTTYSYDAFGRVQTAELPGLAQPVEYQWHPDGLMRQVSYPGGMTRAYEYDDADRVSRILNTVNATESEEYVYGYDANGNRSTETRRQNGALTRELTYGYDALNRLTSTEYHTPTVPTATTSWSYDAVGNRLATTGQTWNGSALNTAYTYNSTNELTAITDNLDPAKNLTLEYDPNGNLAREISPSGTERRFQHDAFNQLRRVLLRSGETETPVGIYDYDFEGRRVHRWSATEELYYVYHGLNVTNEYDRWGQLAATYDFGLPGGLAQPVQWQLLGNRLHSGLGGAPAGGAPGTGWTPDFGPPGDLVRANFAAEGERFYFHDALGSTTMLAGIPAPGSPAVAARYEYDPWGNQLSTPQPSLNRVNFTTYRNDVETGLEYAIARYYSTIRGLLLEVDPFIGTHHPMPTTGSRLLSGLDILRLYHYVSNSPGNLRDPSGRYGIDVHMGLTEYLANAAGFASDDARRLGEWNQSVDTLTFTNPLITYLYFDVFFDGMNWEQKRQLAMLPHFPRGPGESTVVANSAYVQAVVENAIEMGSLWMFGQALHTYQDSWSHEDSLDAHWDKSLDYTWIENRWKTRDLTMAQEVYVRLVRYLDRNPNVRVRDSAPFPASFVSEYLRRDSLAQKEVMLRIQGGMHHYAKLRKERSLGFPLSGTNGDSANSTMIGSSSSRKYSIGFWRIRGKINFTFSGS